jgi:transposase
VLPPPRAQPMVLWVFDERRFGVQPIWRRRLTARGTKPVGPVQPRFENFYRYGAVPPSTGVGFFLGLPRLNASHVQIFLDRLAQAHPNTLHVLLLDNSRCHTARALCLPDNIILLFQEPYAPELNPMERVWEDLKAALAWTTFADLPALQARIVELVRAYDAATLTSLTSYPYIVEAVNAVCL